MVKLFLRRAALRSARIKTTVPQGETHIRRVFISPFICQWKLFCQMTFILFYLVYSPPRLFSIYITERCIVAPCPVCDCMLSLLYLASIVDNMWLHKKIGTVRRFNSDNSVSSSGRHPTFLYVFKKKQTLKQTFGTLRDKNAVWVRDRCNFIPQRLWFLSYSRRQNNKTKHRHYESIRMGTMCFNTRATQRERERRKNSIKTTHHLYRRLILKRRVLTTSVWTGRFPKQHGGLVLQTAAGWSHTWCEHISAGVNFPPSLPRSPCFCSTYSISNPTHAANCTLMAAFLQM